LRHALSANLFVSSRRTTRQTRDEAGRANDTHEVVTKSVGNGDGAANVPRFDPQPKLSCGKAAPNQVMSSNLKIGNGI
jgi:hypothetical protein